MSVFNHYTLSPGAVASMTEPTPDLQRNYRQRDMLDGYGELQQNGRWLYSLDDLVAIWICDHISQHGQNLDRRDGFRLGKSLASRVTMSFLNRRHSRDGAVELNPLRGRYVVYLFQSENPTGLGGFEYRTINSLTDLEHTAFSEARIYDIESIANALPESIRALLVVADENEVDELTPNYGEMLANAPELGIDD